MKTFFAVLRRPAGFEPATRCLEGSCSVRLSYGRSEIIVPGEYHASATYGSQCVAPPTTCGQPESTNKASAVTTSPISAVQRIEAEQLDPRVGPSRFAQADIEACSAVAGQLRRTRVVPLDREQVPSPAEPFNMANGMILSHLPHRATEPVGEARVRPVRARPRRPRSDCGERVGDNPSRHLTRRFAKGVGARLRQRPVPAARLECGPATWATSGLCLTRPVIPSGVPAS